MPDVEAELSFAGHDIGSPGLDRQLPDRGDQARISGGVVLDRKDELCGCGEGVVAAVHRRRACMRSLTRKEHLESHLAGDRGDNADWQVASLEHGSLLDVNLAITEQPPAVPPVVSDAIRIAVK